MSQPLERTDLNSILNGDKLKEQYINELIHLCKSDDNVNEVIRKFNVTDTFLKDVFHRLQSIGAGQNAGGHYVPASSLAYAPTLRFLLNHFDGENFSINNYDHYNSNLFIAHRLIRYFEKGEVGELKF